MASNETFDAVVIGAGEAGALVASLAVEAGKRVAMVYKQPYGSTCLNTGCVPSKYMIERARVAQTVRTAGRFHIQTASPTVDLAAIVREKNEMIDRHREESFAGARAAPPLTLVEGEAHFVSSHQVVAAGRVLESDKIFIATGMRPLMPSINGIDQVGFFTNDNIMELERLPEHLVVVGGGYIACELGQMFRRYGSEVTIIQSRAHLLPQEEPDVSTLLERALVAEGIELLLNYRAIAVRADSGRIRSSARADDGDMREIEGTHLLIAAGRKPNSDMLRLEAAGIETDEKGAIRVNDYLETNVLGVWAIGDVNGEQPFTRVCQEEGKIAYVNAFEAAAVKMERQALGHAVFTEPEVAGVGLTESDARSRGYDVAAGLVTFDRVERAEMMGQTIGLIKYVADRETHRLLGCHVIGPAAAELIYDAIVVMRHEGTLDELAKAVGIFPTIQEGMEGTARALLRRVAPQEVRGPLIAGSVHQTQAMKGGE